MNNVASVKDRLNNVKRKTGKPMEQLLVTYGFERTIYRISLRVPLNRYWKTIRSLRSRLALF